MGIYRNEIENNHEGDRFKQFQWQSNISTSQYSKKKFFQISLVFIFICFAQNSVAQYSKIDISSISDDTKNDIYNFVYNSFTTCSETPIITSKNSTSRFRKNFTKNKISSYCSWFTERFGEIEEVLLAEVVYRNENQVFRYKVARTKSDWYSEIRISVNKKGKLDWINSKGFWADWYYEWGENPKPFRVDKTLLNDSIVKQNKEFALKSYSICEASEIYEVNETNAIYRSIRKGWKAEMLKECDSVKAKNGNFKNLMFEEFLTDSISTKIYRYKVDFDELNKPSEIRVYSKLNDKYTGIFVVDVWYDKYFNLKEALEKSRNDLGN